MKAREGQRAAQEDQKLLRHLGFIQRKGEPRSVFKQSSYLYRNDFGSKIGLRV